MNPACTIIITCLVLLLPGLSHGEEAQHSLPHVLSIGVPTDVLQDYVQFIGNRTPQGITNYGGPHSRRDVVEVVLIQQALSLGGLDSPIAFSPAPTYLRMLKELETGRTALTATSIWLSDLSDDASVYRVSDAVIENGQFEAGLYTSEYNSTAHSASTLSHVRRLTAVSNRYWTPDWATLSEMNLKNLRHIQDWKTMVRTVSFKRADFLLAPFQPTKNMSLRVDGMTLVPIPNIKVGLKGSRHFAISSKYPGAEIVYQALQKGLGILKTKGVLERAYRESGFFNQNVQGWKRLN